MIQESENCSKVIETEFNNHLVTTKKDHEDFKNSTTLKICKKTYEEGKVKVKDSDRIARKY